MASCVRCSAVLLILVACLAVCRVHGSETSLQPDKSAPPPSEVVASTVCTTSNADICAKAKAGSCPEATSSDWAGDKAHCAAICDRMKSLESTALEDCSKIDTHLAYMVLVGYSWGAKGKPMRSPGRGGLPTTARGIDILKTAAFKFGLPDSHVVTITDGPPKDYSPAHPYDFTDDFSSYPSTIVPLLKGQLPSDYCATKQAAGWTGNCVSKSIPDGARVLLVFRTHGGGDITTTEIKVGETPITYNGKEYVLSEEPLKVVEGYATGGTMYTKADKEASSPHFRVKSADMKALMEDLSTRRHLELAVMVGTCFASALVQNEYKPLSHSYGASEEDGTETFLARIAKEMQERVTAAKTESHNVLFITKTADKTTSSHTAMYEKLMNHFSDGKTFAEYQQEVKAWEAKAGEQPPIKLYLKSDYDAWTAAVARSKLLLEAEPSIASISTRAVFHPDINRDSGYALLQGKPKGSWLVRPSSRGDAYYAMDVVTGGSKPSSYLIRERSNGWSNGLTGRKYATWNELLSDFGVTEDLAVNSFQGIASRACFHPDIDRKAGYALLKGKPDGSWLLRPSSRGAGFFALDVQKGGAPSSYLVQEHSDAWEESGHSYGTWEEFLAGTGVTAVKAVNADGSSPVQQQSSPTEDSPVDTALQTMEDNAEVVPFSEIQAALAAAGKRTVDHALKNANRGVLGAFGSKTVFDKPIKSFLASFLEMESRVSRDPRRSRAPHILPSYHLF